ncbi:MAG: hypothetical protein A2908_00435 [Candidatus Staskawiczbacteria bacterium RIFCSPLOWO2_01_FULL_38_12b]|uniref:Uncharacterized protein n=1 Tax=Candidatus Staskawiczbacteria bacterium RIFCSPLOWO2_01_FULL_38_12b TaxID=1802214 RepID=A0A1G2IG19_9BACT|nr:MAG: hypothetical protein A2908_00435 [Candidatus Staskawiczbacteria bacterium RIFCSPLOWO2_01_FULL_38_12b]
MERRLHHLLKSFKYLFYFYVAVLILVAVYVIVSKSYNVNLLIACGIVFGGNLFLGIVTQSSNYIIEKYSYTDKSRDFLYLNFTDCFFRSLAGLAEIILYTVSFAMGMESLVAGYLLLKTVSIWQDKDNYNNKKEGLHTAILRIAIVISLLISLVAAFYLKKFINSN